MSQNLYLGLSFHFIKYRKLSCKTWHKVPDFLTHKIGDTVISKLMLSIYDSNCTQLETCN